MSLTPVPLWAIVNVTAMRSLALSYTTFRYDPVEVSPARIAPDGSATVTVRAEPEEPCDGGTPGVCGRSAFYCNSPEYPLHSCQLKF